MWKLLGRNRSPVIPKRPTRDIVEPGTGPPASLRVAVAQNPDADELTFIEHCLLKYNLEHAGPHLYRKLAVFLRDPDGKVLGGITGSTYWGWLTVEFLWVPEELRAKGYGKQLLAAIENEARERGCHHACLDTFTFQGAVGFYEKYGYSRLGSLPSFPFGHERIYFHKVLAS